MSMGLVAASRKRRRRTRSKPGGRNFLRVNQVPYVEATLEDGVQVWLQLDTGSFFAVTLWRQRTSRYWRT